MMLSSIVVLVGQQSAWCLLLVALIYTIYLSGRVVYNLFFHPLARFPGPILHAATPLPFVRWQLAGRLPYMYANLHQRYGDVVRVLPNELSFANPQAWNEIYGYASAHKGHGTLTKVPSSYIPSSEGAFNIVTVTNVEDHARYRHVLNPAFADRAMRQQEPMIQQHLEMLVTRLKEQDRTCYVDLVRWFNLFFFDLISYLTYGKSLDGMKTGTYHPWVEGLFGSAIKHASLSRAVAQFPHIAPILRRFLLPTTLLEQRDKHERYVGQFTQQRMESETTSRDFMSYILPFDATKTRLSLPEIRAVYGVMMLAGSENLVSTLSITIYYLLKYPAHLKAAVHEVRQFFVDSKSIDMARASRLSYVSAVIQEAMRLQPAAPTSQQRLIPVGGATICGHDIPAATIVSVPPICLNVSETNFKDADEFRPERWLGDPKYASDNRSAFQPFGVGPRSCIGKSLAQAELRLTLARLLWEFDLELAPGCHRWAEELKVYHLWELAPFCVRLQPVDRTAIPYASER